LDDFSGEAFRTMIYLSSGFCIVVVPATGRQILNCYLYNQNSYRDAIDQTGGFLLDTRMNGRCHERGMAIGAARFVVRTSISQAAARNLSAQTRAPLWTL